MFSSESLFLPKKRIFIQNAYKEHLLFDKKTYNWKTKAVIFKSQHTFLDIIMLMLLAKFEFDRWFHIGIIKKIGLHLKPDDVIKYA